MRTLPTILVADSDATSYFIVRKYFEIFNARVKWIYCTSARETLARIDEVRPDVLILEPFMPDMKVPDFLEALDESGAFSRYCVCLLSLLAVDELTAAAAPYNIFGAWSKPLEQRAVRAVLKEVLACKQPVD